MNQQKLRELFDGLLGLETSVVNDLVSDPNLAEPGDSFGMEIWHARLDGFVVQVENMHDGPAAGISVQVWHMSNLPDWSGVAREVHRYLEGAPDRLATYIAGELGQRLEATP